MSLPIYQVDAFADAAFKGNPAAVVPLDAWLPDDLLQAIAAENNLSETAFFVPQPEKGLGNYRLRWFTPAAEVELCGHATLASAYCLLTDIEPGLDEVSFETRSGTLIVKRGEGGLLSMDFPAQPAQPVTGAEAEKIIPALERALGRRPVELHRSVNLMAVYDSEKDLHALRYSVHLDGALKDADSWGLIVTAPPAETGRYDFLSRFFAPLKGLPEDPVTGSAHCTLAPYWSARIGQSTLTAYQASQRGGVVHCHCDGSGRVRLSGRCVPYLKGHITLD